VHHTNLRATRVVVGVHSSSRPSCVAHCCRLRGLRDSADFCAYASYGHLLDQARIPLLFISAENDPICPAKSIPLATTGSAAVARTTVGGHIAFADAGWPFMNREDWDTRVALDFFAAYLADVDRGQTDGQMIERPAGQRQGRSRRTPTPTPTQRTSPRASSRRQRRV
jgi:hypothetical protein